MKETVASYLKIVLFAIKNKKIIEYLNLKWQKDTDRFRNKRKNEYIDKAINHNAALSILLPNKTLDSKIFLDLDKHIEKFITQKKLQKYPSNENPYPVKFGLDRNVCRLLFSLCFFNKPNYVIETGVANGFSSSYILYAMNLVQKGKLISIDNLVRPWHTKEKIGTAIPSMLKNRHVLIIGNAPIELKKLCKTINMIDIFIHDSSHTYKNMMNEFDIAWPHIKNGGLLLADDISQNDAFLEFAGKVNKTPIIIKNDDGYFGLIQK